MIEMNMDIDLPKWPATFITGESVTLEQAKDILFRTDGSLSAISLYGFGNDRKFRDLCQDAFGWKPIIEMQESKSDDPEIRGRGWELSSLWAEKMGHVHTEYIYNRFLATSYIYGPTGWCNPDGRIHFEGHNIGKYPSIDEVAREWDRLLTAFPYINLVCTLFSGEHCEEGAEPLVTFVVRNGVVSVIPPDLSLHSVQPKPPVEEDDDNLVKILTASIHGDYSFERGWPDDWVMEFAEKSKAAVDAVIKENL